MVPVLDLSRAAARMGEAFSAAVARVLGSGTFLLGDETHGLEAELATWAGSPHAVAVASGASALQLSLAALDVGPGDEVVVPAFTAVPTASAVLAVGATPVFADVDDTAAVTTGSVEAVRTDRTKAVIVVHLYGRPAPLPDTDLPIVEDAAQAHGAIVDHVRSAAVVYSFYPTKNLGGIGDGGAVVTSRDDVADRVRLLRVHGMTEQYVHEAVSQNFRMSELEAAWLRLRLATLASDNARRQQIARHYREAAPRLRWHPDHSHHVYHLCVARVRDRERARAFLRERGIATAVHYPLALTQQPAYRCFARTKCPIAEEWAASCLTLPCFAEMTDVEVDAVIGALIELAEESWV